MHDGGSGQNHPSPQNQQQHASVTRLCPIGALLLRERLDLDDAAAGIAPPCHRTLPTLHPPVA